MKKAKLLWDIGTAYDFFGSLHVLQNPDRFGLRGSWAAGVRSRLPHLERSVLEQVDLVFWMPSHWIYDLPGPKDALTALRELEKMPPAQRLLDLGLPPSATGEMRELVNDVVESGQWSKKHLDQLKNTYKTRHRPSRQGAGETVLDVWAQAAEVGEKYLQALHVYFEVFFAEEEQRILPALEKSLDRARRLSMTLDVEALIEELSLGVRFVPPLFQPDADLVLAPAYWTTPLVIYDRLVDGGWIFLFGGRPVEASLVPGELVPDTMLQGLKALADPTRLRILRYLEEQPMTPSQLARHLRLRAPTVVHHLSELRLAGLVYLTVDAPEKKSERRYAARLEAVNQLYETLRAFLTQEDIERAEELLKN